MAPTDRENRAAIHEENRKLYPKPVEPTTTEAEPAEPVRRAPGANPAAGSSASPPPDDGTDPDSGLGDQGRGTGRPAVDRLHRLLREESRRQQIRASQPRVHKISSYYRS